MQTDIKRFQRPVRPAECAIMFGIPTSRNGFDRHLVARDRHDFVPNVCPAWPAYAEIIQQIEESIRVWEVLGVTVVREAGLGNLTVLCEGNAAVVVFSHWTPDLVEFDDGMKAARDVVAAVPAAYDGVLDLCVCHPDPLVMALRRERPDCLVKRTRSKARASLWLHFYGVLFRVLAERECAYGEAVRIAALALMGSSIDTGDVK